MTEREFQLEVLRRLDRADEDRRVRFEHVGSAIAEVRSDVRAGNDALNSHCAQDDIRFKGITSDLRELKHDIRSADDTSRTMAVEAARAGVLVSRGTQDWTEQRASKRDWLRQAAIGLLLVAAGAMISFLTTR